MVAADATSVVTIMRPLMDFWSTLRGLLRVTVSRVTPHMKGTELSACKIMMKRILGFEISLAKVLRTTLKSLSCLVVSSPSRSPFRLRLFLGAGAVTHRGSQRGGGEWYLSAQLCPCFSSKSESNAKARALIGSET